ncbi:hypothetical protein OsI_16368 [Oryza sativa Indica Group]|uniref:Uncharacterized protein n=3 Tax=Oryza TaxID=4527 RepID=A3AUZ9_ORYSJ|nr:hypothetical protein OsI_16368 [Oryza sativa Indica Group]EAZ31138.1 hypothetical protein OsJ_15235 [Oryza sativa Japonica Group]
MANDEAVCLCAHVQSSLLSVVCCELKAVVSMVTGLEPREQRPLFRGKEREDSDHLKDMVLLLEDPALKDMKLRATLVARATI